MKQKIGVYICHCGGNISDYVDVKELKNLFMDEEGVIISKNVMFACSDSSQKEIVNDIQEKQLDAIVVASCSPKLHLHTFKSVAERAGLNPNNYVQVNIREQCSWPHSDLPEAATVKAAGLIRAGIKRVALSADLDGFEISATKAVLVIGAGIAGMTAALSLAKAGNNVFLIEKEAQTGGRLLNSPPLFPHNQNPSDIISKLKDEIKTNSAITVFTNATVEKLSGNVGNFNVTININNEKSETLSLTTGAILVSTGLDTYSPVENDYAFNSSDNIITLPAFNKVLADNIKENKTGKLIINNKEIKRIAFIYCVGNRQTKGENKYCSRICCSATIQAALTAKKNHPGLKLFHLFRDIRTYGKQELLYRQSSAQGDIYLRFDEKEPPIVAAEKDKIKIKIKDLLTSKKEFELEADLLVLVTGMVACSDSKIVAEKLKIPVGNDKFFNEIHPKLKPVETVIKGIFIGGSCQGPKNISESVQSSLSAVAKISALLSKGVISLDPNVAIVDKDKCMWCGKCAEVCEYDAIQKINHNDKEIAVINNAKCTGCGICLPVCPEDALQLAQYTDKEIIAMIDGFTQKIILKDKEDQAPEIKEKKKNDLRGFPKLWKTIANCVSEEAKTIPQIALELNLDSKDVTYNIMTMNKYNIITSQGLDKSETYYLYKLNQ
ncbi:MAG: CoB--CoM heterodisulfide reductase iron-sulfur subunit A family protein [Bacteroidales bacterium]|nr:CoB--CoM heterodisulfide reductase iron-sulfur subunit A family protein [Bacteroidales bacterium]